MHKYLHGLLSLVMSGENNGKMIANLQSPVLLVGPLPTVPIMGDFCIKIRLVQKPSKQASPTRMQLYVDD